MKINICLFLIILMACFVNANGNFNEALAGEITGLKTVSAPNFIPYVYDFDNNTVNEILIVDGHTLKLYKDETLTEVDGLTLSLSSVSDIEIFDFENDGIIEIVTVCDNDDIISIAQYNGTDFYEKQIYNLSISHTDGEMMLGCGDNKCLLVFSDSIKLKSTPFLYGVGFNLTNISSVSVIREESALYSTVWCFPNIRNIVYSDYDNDLTKEFIFTVNEVSLYPYNFQQSFYDILIIEISNNLSVSVKDSTFLGGIAFDIGTGTESCISENYGKYLTSPIVEDLEIGREEELVFGVMTHEDNFLLYMYDDDLNVVDYFPELILTQGNGEIISNIILIDVFDESGKKDFCVMGYDSSVNEIDLLCGSKKSSGIESSEFQFNTENYWSLNGIYDMYIQTTEQNSVRPNEISSSYGIFEIDYSGDNSLNLIYLAPKSDGVVIMSDVQNLELDDMLILTDTNLWYIDDGFSNSDGYIVNYTINPCIEAVWKENTTVGITIKVEDVDFGDTVQARAILYYGDENQQSTNWTELSKSGTTFPFSFIANKTIASGKISLQGRDNKNPDNIDEILLSFSVNQNGVSFGDCITVGGGLTIIDEIDGGTQIQPNNVIDEQMDTYTDRTGLTRSIVWLVGMCLIAGVLFVLGHKNNVDDKSNLIVISIIEILALIIGTKMDYLSAGIIWTIIIIGLMAIGVIISSKFFGRDNQ